MTNDPYPLSKTSDDVPPRIRLTGGEYPQGHDPTPRQLDQGGERPPVIQQRNAGAGDRAFNVAQADQAPPPQFDDWLEVPFHPRLRKNSNGTYSCFIWPGYVIHVKTKDADAGTSYDLPAGLTKTSTYVVADGQTIGVHVVTDPFDVPTSVEIAVWSGAKTWTQARQPPHDDDDSDSDPSAGRNGDYWYKIADFENYTSGIHTFLRIAHVYQLGHILHVGDVGSGYDADIRWAVDTDSDSEADRYVGLMCVRNGHVVWVNDSIRGTPTPLPTGLTAAFHQKLILT